MLESLKTSLSGGGSHCLAPESVDHFIDEGTRLVGKVRAECCIPLGRELTDSDNRFKSISAPEMNVMSVKSCDTFAATFCADGF